VVLSANGICKSFPGVRALHQVDFSLRRGEIMALLGENGAGKSTLVKTLTGVYQRDAGRIELDGVAINPTDTAHAQRHRLSGSQSAAEHVGGRQPVYRS
jgi:simple sugar transport system ATP-binding protein